MRRVHWIYVAAVGVVHHLHHSNWLPEEAHKLYFISFKFFPLDWVRCNGNVLLFPNTPASEFIIFFPLFPFGYAMPAVIYKKQPGSKRMEVEKNIYEKPRWIKWTTDERRGRFIGMTERWCKTDIRWKGGRERQKHRGQTDWQGGEGENETLTGETLQIKLEPWICNRLMMDGWPTTTSTVFYLCMSLTRCIERSQTVEQSINTYDEW